MERDAAQKAVTLVKNKQDILPLSPDKTKLPFHSSQARERLYCAYSLFDFKLFVAQTRDEPGRA